jgi:hypothetical protein
MLLLEQVTAMIKTLEKKRLPKLVTLRKRLEKQQIGHLQLATTADLQGIQQPKREGPQIMLRPQQIGPLPMLLAAAGKCRLKGRFEE